MKNRLFLLFTVCCLTASAQGKFDQLVEKSYQELNEGEIISAFKHLEEAKNIIPENMDLSEKAIFFNDFGVTCYQLGKYKEGIDAYKISLELSCKIGKDTLIAEFSHNLGLAYKEIGLFELATRELIKSAQIFEKNQNLKGLSSVWNALGNMQRDLGDFKKALDYHIKALRLRESIHYAKGIADSYHNIGYVYLEQFRNDDAIQYLKKALELKQNLKNRANQITTLTLLGKVYLEKRKLKKAFFYMNLAYDMRLESGNTSKAAFSLYNLGSFYVKVGNVRKAKMVYQQAEHIAEISRDYLLLSDILLEEINLLQHDSEIHLLIKKYQTLIRVEKQLERDINRKELTKLEIIYDVERKNNELDARRNQAKLDKVNIENQHLRNRQLSIWLLLLVICVCIVSFSWIRIRKQKNRIEQQNGILSVQKKEITSLHRELSHRTKNYFNLLSGILAADLKKIDNPETINFIQINRQRLDAMSSIQKYLLYESEATNNEIQLDSYLNEIVDLVLDSLFPNGYEFQLKKEMQAIKLDYDKAMRIAIVLNELICNAIEHGLSNRKNPLLEIILSLQKEQLEIIVRDNGPGIINVSEFEYEFNNGTSLIKKILIPIEGIIAYKNENGCVARIQVPV